MITMISIDEAKKRASELLGQMSLEEKMGQIVGYYPKTWSREELKRDYPHGAGQVACFGMRELDSLDKIVEYQKEIQDQIMELSENHIPAIFHMEGLCGVLIQDAECFPSGIGRAATWNSQLEEKVGEIVGKQSRAVGASQILAPVLDISRDSRFGRQGETYGEDPALVSALGAAYIRGLQKEREGMLVESTAKHFLSYHNSQGGIHASECETPRRLLREVYAKPFQASITESGLRGIMPCYGAIDGEPASASKPLLQELLRGEMGFDGLVIADYCSISEIHDRQKMCESVTEAGVRALEAGVDMELPSKKSYNEELNSLFLDGTVDMALLDRAVIHILTEKFRMGLFEKPYGLNGNQLYSCFHQELDREVCLQTALESMVLLKNDGVLPISPKIKKIAVIGYHASSTRALFGGYTHMSMTERWLGAANTMAGMEVENTGYNHTLETYPETYVQKEHHSAEKLAKKIKPQTNNLLEELIRRLPNTDISYNYGYSYAGTDESGHETALEAAGKADLVLVTLGGKYGTGSMASTGEGIDATNINLPPCQESFLRKLVGITKPVVAVHFDGRPISSGAADRFAGAILEAWNPGERGAEAIVKTLLGEYNPAGRLPVSVARVAGQEPIYYNHSNGSSYHQGTIGAFTSYMDSPYEPRYCFGHGLSYTSFYYSDLKIIGVNNDVDWDGKEQSCWVMANDRIQVSVKVKNIGTMAGAEVVQVYLRDVFASMLRPVMELAGWKKVQIDAGEEKTIVFQIHPSQVAFIDREQQWKVEKGDLEVFIGASSDDIRLKGKFYIAEDKVIDERRRGFYCIGSVI
ncbi:glycoside hydrolase family 3 N-terminal domain-containing protein [Anaerocolumna jejuensis]|uniref:glycoside hydrolase family 3 N-terminal domain-containing protein n=1 Tax=Anaerocolumna jejuensis TaxID=259063 RepID=UPI003F7B5EB5